MPPKEMQTATQPQHDVGKKSDTELKPEAWVICCEAIQEKYTGIEYIKIKKLKSKLDYKGRWNAWKWVGEQSGVGRDPISSKYTALDETWEIFFKKKPSYRWIKTQDLEYRDILEKLFIGRSANGKHVESITSRQIEFEQSSDTKGLSSTAGSSHFPETFTLDSESDQANSAPYKGLDQDSTPRSMGLHRDKPTSSGQKTQSYAR